MNVSINYKSNTLDGSLVMCNVDLSGTILEDNCKHSVAAGPVSDLQAYGLTLLTKTFFPASFIPFRSIPKQSLSPH